MADGRDDPEIHWIDPQLRGIFPIDQFHISRSLARRIRQGGYEAVLNGDFAATVTACAARDETWINAEIFSLYNALHEEGFAHSLEIRQNGELVGGVYGVAIGGAFFGESMFSRVTDGSKLALAHLMARLRQGGFTLFDTQFLTPHLASLGAIEISRSDYQKRLKMAIEQQADIHKGAGTVLPN